MPGRKYEAQSGYRYGFNGKEKDKDLNSLTAYDYGFRIYNPGIGKFLSVDPLSRTYPELTPYQFASNSPIAHVDVDGREAVYYLTTVTNTFFHEPNGDSGGETTHMVQTISVEKQTTGWFTQGNLYTPNRALGSGTLYTVQTKVVDVYSTGMGLH